MAGQGPQLLYYVGVSGNAAVPGENRLHLVSLQERDIFRQQQQQRLHKMQAYFPLTKQEC